MYKKTHEYWNYNKETHLLKLDNAQMIELILGFSSYVQRLDIFYIQFNVMVANLF